MNTNLKHLHHNIVIALSFVYSVYVVSHYLSTILPTFLFENDIAIVSALTLSYLTHAFLNDFIREIALKRLMFASVLIVVVLVGLVFSSEYKGLQTLSEGFNVDNSRLKELYQQKTALENQLVNTGTSNNWQKVELRRSLSEQLKLKGKEIEKEEIRVSDQQTKADNQANHLRVVSLVLIALSGMVMFKKFSYNSTRENYKTPIFDIEKEGLTNLSNHKNEITEKEIGFNISEINIPISKIEKFKNLWQNGERNYPKLCKGASLNSVQIKKLIQLLNYN